MQLLFTMNATTPVVQSWRGSGSSSGAPLPSSLFPSPLLVGCPSWQSSTALHPLQVAVVFHAVIVRRPTATIIERQYSFLAAIHQFS
jgi:hypothetical protein